MGNSSVKEAISSVSSSTVNGVTVSAATEKPKCKACCACPETKKARDSCIMENGEENCSKLIEAHKKCMKDMGFNV